MYRRLGLALVLFASVAAVGLAPRPRVVVGQPVDPTRLNVVRAAYDDLLDLFFQPLDPVDLIVSGWDAVARAGAQVNLPPPPELGPLPDDRDAAFARFSTVYRAYVTNLPPGPTPQDIAFTMVDGMARSVRERHTRFLSPQSFRGAVASLGGEELPVGLGAFFTRSTSPPPWIVTEVVPDSPAEHVGLRSGDTVLMVDGRDVRAATSQEFSLAIGGRVGVTHVLTVDRGGERLDLAVTLGQYYAPPLDSQILPNNVGYIRLRSFVTPGVPLPNGTEILTDLDRRLDELDAQGARALVLDLRNNGGGDGFTALEILGRFLPEDSLSTLAFDERGREALASVSGRMRRSQYPMAVLVNRNTGSASELTVATLREADRAVLVGQRTAGALANAFLLPLPDGAGMLVAAEELVTALEHYKVDGSGVPVDVEIEDSRTAADYRAAHDPQLDAAVDALAQAPPPPAFRSVPSGMTEEELSRMLAGYLPRPDAIPTNDRLMTVGSIATHDFTHPNQWINFFGPPRDPLALLQTVRGRGWLGSHLQVYNPLVPPSVLVSIDLYATAEGAAAALSTNDFPDLQEPVPSPVQLGEQTAAYRTIGFGIWGLQAFGLGRSILWRRGNVVFTVLYSDAPALVPVDTLVALAQRVDQTFQQNPLPAPGTKAAGRTAPVPSSALRTDLALLLRQDTDIPTAAWSTALPMRQGGILVQDEARLEDETTHPSPERLRR